jgi:deoxycytidine triphosphate deaminase
MFLLSDVLIRRYMKHRGFSIHPFLESNLGQTCYYFRVGQYADILTDDQGSINIKERGLALPPGTMASIQSLETFHLPDHVLGLLGSQTANALKHRIHMLHGPSIDPGYQAPIEFVVINIGQRPVDLTYGARIGKVMFFDVTETNIDDIHLYENARRRQSRLARREPVADNPDAEFESFT